MDKSDTRYSMIAQRISDIEQQMQNEGSVMPVSANSAISVTVSLANELFDKQPQQGTLFIFAKAAQGSPMPLAVVKLVAILLGIHCHTYKKAQG